MSKFLNTSFRIHPEFYKRQVYTPFEPILTLSNGKHQKTEELISNYEQECLPEGNRCLDSWARMNKVKGTFPINYRQRHCKSEYKDASEPSLNMKLINTIVKDDLIPKITSFDFDKLEPMKKKSIVERISEMNSNKDNKQKKLVERNSKLIFQILNNKIKMQGKKITRSSSYISTINQFSNLKEIFGERQSKNKVCQELTQFKVKQKIDRSQTDRSHLFSFELQEKEIILDLKLTNQGIKDIEEAIHQNLIELSQKVSLESKLKLQLFEMSQQKVDNERKLTNFRNLIKQSDQIIQHSPSQGSNNQIHQSKRRKSLLILDNEKTPLQLEMLSKIEKIKLNQSQSFDIVTKAQTSLQELYVQQNKIKQYQIELDDHLINQKNQSSLMRNQLISIYHDELKEYEYPIGKKKSITYFMKVLWDLEEVFEKSCFPSHLTIQQHKQVFMLGLLQYEKNLMESNQKSLKTISKIQQLQEIRIQLKLNFPNYGQSNAQDKQLIINNYNDMIDKLNSQITDQMKSSCDFNHMKVQTKQLYIIFGDQAKYYESQFDLKRKLDSPEINKFKRIPSALLRKFKQVGLQQGQYVEKILE